LSHEKWQETRTRNRFPHDPYTYSVNLSDAKQLTSQLLAGLRDATMPYLYGSVDTERRQITATAGAASALTGDVMPA